MHYGPAHAASHVVKKAEVVMAREDLEGSLGTHFLLNEEAGDKTQNPSPAARPDEGSVFFFDTKNPLNTSHVGGKAANLQKLSHVENITIPPWFVLSALPFQEFLEENGLTTLILQLDTLCQNAQEQSEAIKTLATKIQSLIKQGSLNSNLSLKIKKSYETLCSHAGKPDLTFAVRSSGVIEDGSLSSCAGLYDTELNVCGFDNIIIAIKSVWASSFNLRVVQERTRLNIKQTQCQMGVLVQQQINSRAAGVVSTLVLGNNYPGIQVSGNYGVGESVVSGEVSVDGWVLHPEEGYILEVVKGSKESCHALSGHHGVEKVGVLSAKREAFVLSRDELSQLFGQVKKIHAHYGCDVDIEYAVDQEGALFILQTRPLVSAQTSNLQVIDVKDGEELCVIGKGHYAVAGVASGRLIFINSLEQLEKGEIVLDPQDIVLAYVTTNVWSQYLGHIQGLVTREGSPSSHPILLAREKQIPCVIGISDGFEELIKHSGQIVTVDGFNKCVYSGRLSTKNATQEDLQKQFETVSVRQWPQLATSLPHLLHNKMAVELEGSYWRRTPTYPVAGFQREINLLRFDIVPSLLKKEGTVKIASAVIEGYTCCALTPFSDYVALFEGFKIEDAQEFNRSHQSCIQKFLNASAQCTRSKEFWKNYINSYAELRCFVWLGDALRSYAQRKVELLAAQAKLPVFYLEECSREIQATIPELDAQMHQELYHLAVKFQSIPFVDDVEALKIEHAELYRGVEEIGKKYRFEHAISLDRELDLNVVYARLKREIEVVSRKKPFLSDKKSDLSRTIIPELTELKAWLHIAIWNRILQSDSHHIDARAKEIVRPQLQKLGQILAEKHILHSSGDLFICSVEEIAQYIQNVNL